MSDKPQQEDTPLGLFYATSAFVLWGLLPFVLKAVEHIPAVEVVAHRVIWSLPIVAVILIYTKRTSDIKAALKSPKTLGMAVICSLLISINWGIYVWAISVERTVEASMGYYVTPLVAILVGATILGEKLSTGHKISAAIATVAVAILAWDAGSVPLVAIGLAGSWSIYSFLRKTLPIGANQGFMLEVLILLVPSLCVVGWLTFKGESHFGQTEPFDIGMLLFCGVATAVPLMLFTNGTRLIRMSSLGVLQFIAPTIIFLVAVLVFDEPFSATKMVAFVLIWIAMSIFAYTLVKKSPS